MANPEGALKTIVSRLRTLLNGLSPDLGLCIAAEHGAYRWNTLPGMSIDYYEMEDCLSKITKLRDGDEAARRALYEQMLQLYAGDFLCNCELSEWAFSRATLLHNQYIAAAHQYIELLKGRKEDKKVITVCHRVLEVDPYDEQTNIELMSALLQENQIAEAKAKYDEVIGQHYHFFNTEPSKTLKDFYYRIAAAGRVADFNLEDISHELRGGDQGNTALLCDYSMFKELFNILIRNIDRHGFHMMLAVTE